MSFHNVRLPVEVERGAQGGPMFDTTVLELRSGHEQRNINWQQTRARYNISYGISHKDELEAVIHFFYARYGRAYGFRFKDWGDYEVPLQVLGLGDGATVDFQAFKRYSDGTYTFDRPLTKLVADTIEVFVEGVPVSFTADVDTGIITLASPPAATGGSGTGGAEVVSYLCEFDVPVRFNDDALNVTMELWNVGQIPAIEIVEVRK
ncbi:MAG: DUF2460 domain-containing protein [Synergistaceae bacterium]